MKFQRYKLRVNNYKAFKETNYHEQEPANSRTEHTETSDTERTRCNYKIVCLITLKVKARVRSIISSKRLYKCLNRLEKNSNKSLSHPSVSQFSRSVVSDPLWPHESQHVRPPCPSPTPGVYSNPCPSSRWCSPAISSSVVPFSSCPQALPASESFPMSQLFASGGQSTGVSASASVLPMNTQDWSPLGWTGWISLQSKGLSRGFSNTTVQKHQFRVVLP